MKSDETQISAVEAAQAIMKAAQAKIDKYAEELNRLQKMEAAGQAKIEKLEKGLHGLPSSTPSDLAVADGNATKQHAPTRTVFKILAMKKSEGHGPKCRNCGSTIAPMSNEEADHWEKKIGQVKSRLCGSCREEQANSATPYNLDGGKVKKGEMLLDTSKAHDHEKRVKPSGFPSDGGEVPQLAGNWAGKTGSKEKEKEAPGSGGLKKEETAPGAKPAQPPAAPKPQTVKPAGVPGAKVGQAPSVPKPPSAPGAVGSTMKAEPVGVFKKLKLKKEMK